MFPANNPYLPQVRLVVRLLRHVAVEPAIHHAAFDAHLVGIDPDFRVHVAKRLLKQNDGPMLEVLKKLHHASLDLPARRKDWPDQERLALRFDEFRGYE